MERVADWVSELPWLAIVTLVAGSSLVTLVVGRFLDRAATAAAARREGYARASRALVAWNEYPYRIRRRTSNDPKVVGELVSLGHDLQEELAYVHAWVTADAPWMGKVFAAQRQQIGARVGRACQEAWNLPPLTSTAEMNLGGWGPGNPQVELDALHAASSWRFGSRRAMSLLGRRGHRVKPSVEPPQHAPIPPHGTHP